jgi:hypothetical protein
VLITMSVSLKIYKTHAARNTKAHAAMFHFSRNPAPPRTSSGNPK